MDREKQIIRVSIINMIGNLLLAATKGVVGTLTGSIAITLDALNSLADALSSVIAIIGTKLAGKQADREHPFGYGRVEYFASIAIAALILAAGLEALVESVRSIIHPTTPEYNVVTVVIVAVAAVIKFGLGALLLRKGKALGSGSLVGSGTDSLMDGGVSTATFVAAVLYMTVGLQVESWLAAIIAIMIVRSGVGLLRETISKLLGERVDPKIAARVERAVRSVDGVKFASGLVLLDFGPDRNAGAIHVTVDGRMTVAEFDSIAHAVQEKVYHECGIALASVSPYPDSSYDESTHEIRASVAQVVWGHKDVVEMRGLYIDSAERRVRFDVVVEFHALNDGELRRQIVEACEKNNPGWAFDVRIMPDVAD